MSRDSVSRFLQQIVSQHEIYKKSTDKCIFLQLSESSYQFTRIFKILILHISESIIREEKKPIYIYVKKISNKLNENFSFQCFFFNPMIRIKLIT